MTIKLANTSDIPEGKSIVVRLSDGIEVALFKVNGKIFALENECPHRGGPLGEGDLQGHTVACPWHGWRFDIRDGKCKNMPDEDAKSVVITIDQDADK